MTHPLLDPNPNQQLLLSNEAIVRGALEAGINLIACYPGTPSSEVPDTFNRLRNSARFILEYSVNEKVALEVGAGAALAGALTLVTMKHVGVNVAADPLLTMTYTGLPGGLVLLSADDPGCHASQNEQDNRTYARFASLPCFEPASPQEAKDMTKAALLLARETEQPVLLRTTTRVNHMRGPVDCGPLTAPAPLVPFIRDPARFVPVPASARKQHQILAKNIQKIQLAAEVSPYNTIRGTGPLGIIASGISRAYLQDVLSSNNWTDHVRVFDLGLTWPLPLNKLSDFLRSVNNVVILEEGEALLERDIRALVQKEGIAVTIQGKNEILTIFGEYSTQSIQKALSPLLQPKAVSGKTNTEPDWPKRPPNLCAGCAHRAVYYAVRQVFGDTAFYSSDIGCYTLGLLPPLSAADFLFCMGSSITAGSGFARISQKTVVAFIGDSTFFHSGLSGLANAVFNKHELLVVILDNGTTAMTGHQPNPGVSEEVLGETAVHLDIEKIVRAMGIEHLEKVQAYNLKKLQDTLLRFQNTRGVRVLIVEEPCVLFARRVLKKKRPQIAYVAEQGQKAKDCMATLGCQAFRLQDGLLSVDPDLCSGCMVCVQISPSFKTRKRGSHE